MKTLTDEKIKNMTKEDAKTELSNAVYAATALLEILEGAGKIRGNGHHARQIISTAAESEVEDRWRD